MNQKRSRLFVTDRDLEVLGFLWRWKLASTAALANRFFPGIRAFTAYERLLRLEKKRYIRHVSFRHRGGGAWTLDAQGFRFLLSYLPDMKAKGYRSENPLHDFYATAFHLGEWLTKKAERSLLCSEQELRRLDPDLLPAWVPRSERHRSDGYTVHDSGRGAHLYAFECELSQKSRFRYEETLTFYDSEETIAVVFWLVGSPTIEKAIRGGIATATRPHLHHFMQLCDFERSGWRAPLAGGVFQGKSLANLFLDTPPTEMGRKLDGVGVRALLEKAKRPVLPADKKFASVLACAD